MDQGRSYAAFHLGLHCLPKYTFTSRYPELKGLTVMFTQWKMKYGIDKHKFNIIIRKTICDTLVKQKNIISFATVVVCM